MGASVAEYPRGHWTSTRALRGVIVWAMVRAIQQDETALPLVVIRWSGEASDADFAEFFAAQRALLARRRPYVQIADASRAKVMSSLQRRKMAEFSDDTSAEAARLCKGTAVVISNSLVRGALTAVLWLVKPQYPLVVVATFDEAQACVHRWATDSGLVVPLARMGA